jgi:hypothetical protein
MQDLLLWRRLAESAAIDESLCHLIRQAALDSPEDNWIYCWDLAQRFEELPDSAKKNASRLCNLKIQV